MTNIHQSQQVSEQSPVIMGEYIHPEWITDIPPAVDFCIDPLAPIGAVTVINAHGGTGKSLLSLKMAVHIALGIDILDAIIHSGKVAYMSLEDSELVFRQRLYKITQSMPNDAVSLLEALTQKLLFIDRYGQQTFMVASDSGKIVESEIYEELLSLLQEHNIKCLFVDTFVRTHSLNENDNAQMGALLVLFEKIAARANCAVLLIHHQPKGGSNKDYASRGASAITDNARSVIFLEKVDAKEVDKFDEENIRVAIREGRLVRVVHTKHNYSSQHPEQYFEISREGIPLERFPLLSTTGSLEKRYSELFVWYQKLWKGKPITKTNIDDHYKEIRPKGTTYGKGTYKKALEVAIDEGYAVVTKPPEGASKNPKAKYYALSSFDDP